MRRGLVRDSPKTANRRSGARRCAVRDALAKPPFGYRRQPESDPAGDVQAAESDSALNRRSGPRRPGRGGHRPRPDHRARGARAACGMAPAGQLPAPDGHQQQEQEGGTSNSMGRPQHVQHWGSDRSPSSKRRGASEAGQDRQPVGDEPVAEHPGYGRIGGNSESAHPHDQGCLDGADPPPVRGLWLRRPIRPGRRARRRSGRDDRRRRRRRRPAPRHERR